MNINELIMTLKNLKGVGNKHTRLIVDKYNEEIKDLNDLISILTIENDLLPKKNIYTKNDILTAKNTAMENIRCAQENGIKIVCYLDPYFPAMLKKATNPPTLLFYKGEIKYINEMSGVAIIGTRNPSKLSEKIAYRYSEYLTKKGFYIISGLARGIDEIAHQACLNAEGRTVAFIAQGLGTSIYPKENQKLAEQITVNNGTVFSEYNPDEKPKPPYFIQRDRLQSGLSDGLIVVETKDDGGTMHAANDILKHNKLIGVVEFQDRVMDQKIFSGNLDLLKRGAISIYDKESVDKFIELLGLNSINLEATNEKISLEQIKFNF